MILFRVRFVAKHNENFLQMPVLAEFARRRNFKCETATTACVSLTCSESETHQGGQFENTASLDESRTELPERDIRMAKVRQKNFQAPVETPITPKPCCRISSCLQSMSLHGLQLARRLAKRLERQCDGNVRPIQIRSINSSNDSTSQI